MKNLWIVNYYTAPPKYVSNPRHLEFASNLSDAGYNVTIICSGFYKAKNIKLVPKGKKFLIEKVDKFKIVYVNVRAYKGNGLGRMFSIFQFAWRVYKLRKHFDKPRYILHNVHAPFDYPVIWCSKSLGSKYISEVWDLWPDSFIRMGLISKRNLLVKIAYNIEKSIYEKSDQIIFSFEGGLKYLNDKRWTTSYNGKIDPKKVNYINNGINIQKFNADIETHKINDPDLLDNSHFKVVYIGSIKLANNIRQLIDAAAILQNNEIFKFIIYGDGNERLELEEYCKTKQINNVVFKEKWIQLSHIPFVLSNSSLNILNYKDNFGEYGVSSGKLFQYFASGKPICCNIEVNFCLIKNNNLGISRKFSNAQEYADAIYSIQQLREIDIQSMKERTQEVVKEFDYKNLSTKLIIVLTSLDMKNPL